jgi:hypothetical protein
MSWIITPDIRTTPMRKVETEVSPPNRALQAMNGCLPNDLGQSVSRTARASTNAKKMLSRETVAGCGFRTGVGAGMLPSVA